MICFSFFFDKSLSISLPNSSHRMCGFPLKLKISQRILIVQKCRNVGDKVLTAVDQSDGMTALHEFELGSRIVICHLGNVVFSAIRDEKLVLLWLRLDWLSAKPETAFNYFSMCDRIPPTNKIGPGKQDVFMCSGNEIKCPRWLSRASMLMYHLKLCEKREKPEWMFGAFRDSSVSGRCLPQHMTANVSFSFWLNLLFESNCNK